MTSILLKELESLQQNKKHQQEAPAERSKEESSLKAKEDILRISKKA